MMMHDSKRDVQVCFTRKRKHAPYVNICVRSSNSRHSKGRPTRKAETVGSDKTSAGVHFERCTPAPTVLPLITELSIQFFFEYSTEIINLSENFTTYVFRTTIGYQEKVIHITLSLPKQLIQYKWAILWHCLPMYSHACYRPVQTCKSP